MEQENSMVFGHPDQHLLDFVSRVIRILERDRKKWLAILRMSGLNRKQWERKRERIRAGINRSALLSSK